MNCGPGNGGGPCCAPIGFEALSNIGFAAVGLDGGGAMKQKNENFEPLTMQCYKQIVIKLRWIH